ncbi:hypothetical protein SLEP1_g46082 [Rubroshorea leprosula]|uniref:Uncharacterized protein n=1 Tax=Rubroshorea leprosula TaxID=152421 RepID=A0AAV5LMM5_9ROSI|nr:hypothetical protein SLEP1_g46082 [Rubroshorea leprosula]
MYRNITCHTPGGLEQVWTIAKRSRRQKIQSPWLVRPMVIIFQECQPLTILWGCLQSNNSFVVRFCHQKESRLTNRNKQ